MEPDRYCLEYLLAEENTEPENTSRIFEIKSEWHHDVKIRRRAPEHKKLCQFMQQRFWTDRASIATMAHKAKLFDVHGLSTAHENYLVHCAAHAAMTVHPRPAEPDGRDSCLVELGVYKGRTLSWIALASAMHSYYSVYGVDTWQGSHLDGDLHKDTLRSLESVSNLADPMSIAKQVRLITSDSAEASNNPVFTDDSAIFLFIDAAHDYDSVRRDWDAWKSKVRPMGVVAFHDYHERTPGVVRLVTEACVAGEIMPLMLAFTTLVCVRL